MGGGADLQPAEPRAERGPIGELALAILRRAGFPNDEAVAVFSGVIALNYGWSSFTAAASSTRRPGAESRRPWRCSRRAFPLTVAVAAEIGAYGSDEHYEFVLDRLAGGLR